MKRALLASAILGGLAVKPVHAASDEEMMRQLKAMQAQMAEMQEKMNSLQKELDKTKAEAKSAHKVAEDVKEKMPVKPESDVKITMMPAPKFETADGAYSFKVGGFAQIDAGSFSDDRRDRPNGTNIRRARVNASGVIARDFRYKAEYDFAGNATNITDVYLEYAGFDPFSLMVGNFKEPFGLETLTSDLFTTFLERATPFAFSPDRRIGAQASVYGLTDPIGAWTATLGAFGSTVSSTTSTDDEAFDITGRITLAPIAEKTEVVHLGVAASHRIPDSATDSFSFSSRAENQLSTATPDLSVNTGTITNVDSVNLLGLEAAGVYGPFSLQGEYVIADVNRRAGLFEPEFDGYYVEASYFLTGESRNYVAKQGKFDRVTPKWQFSMKEKQWGAWQLSARYSVLDLNDNPFNRGELKDITLGLRWIPQANVTLTANYIISDTDIYAVTPNDDPELFIVRAQFDF